MNKRNLFWNIYSQDHWTHRSWIIWSLQRVGTNSFHLLCQYWSTRSNDLNSETRNRCNKSFYLICGIERIPYLRSTALSYVRIFICFWYRYNAVHCNMIKHTPLQWLKQNANQTINSQLRYSKSCPYGGIIGRLLWGYGRKLSALGTNFLASNAASNTTLVLHENESYHTERMSRYKY